MERVAQLRAWLREPHRRAGQGAAGPHSGGVGRAVAIERRRGWPEPHQPSALELGTAAEKSPSRGPVRKRTIEHAKDDLGCGAA